MHCLFHLDPSLVKSIGETTGGAIVKEMTHAMKASQQRKVRGNNSIDRSNFI